MVGSLGEQHSCSQSSGMSQPWKNCLYDCPYPSTQESLVQLVANGFEVSGRETSLSAGKLYQFLKNSSASTDSPQSAWPFLSVSKSRAESLGAELTGSGAYNQTRA